MRITLADAIKQLRDDLRTAILEGEGQQDIIFTPRGIDLELGITFDTEVNAEGGVKLFALLDLSTGAKTTNSSQHKVTISLDVADAEGNSLKVRSARIPGGL